jgi:GT2 family glycosyltransferase
MIAREEPVTFSFVIPVKNDAACLQRCLASVAVAARSGVTVVVVDNGSTDDSRSIAMKSGARVIDAPGVTVAEARNRGAAACRGEVLAFVDSDHELAARWVDCAAATLQLPGVAAAGALYSSPTNPSWVQRIYDGFRPRSTGVNEVGWLGSGNMAVWRHAFERVDGFDGGLTACEDVDLCQRLRRFGFRIMSDGGMTSVHHGDPATLRRLFAGELWRGRNNLGVSLRGSLTPSATRGIVVPIVDLSAFVVCGLGALLGGPWRAPAVAAAAAWVGLRLAHAAQVFRRLPVQTLAEAVRTLVVVSVFDAARALALLLRAPHHRPDARRRPVVAAKP